MVDVQGLPVFHNSLLGSRAVMGRPEQVNVSNAVMRGLGLLALSGGLVAIGFWLDQQFEASRGPVRGMSPEVVMWIS